MHHRRLARDYEVHPHRSEALIHLAMIDLMTRRRLTGEITPNWRGT
ncbi:transposase [Streptomyces silvensis]|uniref:Transposase n=1 Tax=Streptomyces silvensis TaxID=1765722 RepID=A0A0W7X6H0_9ACTN|nr:transposase [Streptomyces silvensis]